MRIKFDKYPPIIAGISERSDGSMVWHNRMPVDEIVRGNRDRYFRKIGIDPGRVVSGGIAHGTNVVVAGEKDAGKYLLNTDALITETSNLFLTITIADCMPIFFYDSAIGSLDIVHAGWHGLVGGILENVVNKFQNTYGSKPENLLITIGPHIKSCHYEVGEEVAVQFAKQNIERRNNRLFAKLTDEARMRFRKLGVSHISVDPSCVYEAEQFYSARRDKNEPLRGSVAYIGLRQ